MKDKKIEKLIKEIFKDIALCLYELNYKNRNILLAEYREWIHEDFNKANILMLSYEAYTIRVEMFKEESYLFMNKFINCF